MLRRTSTWSLRCMRPWSVLNAHTVEMRQAIFAASAARSIPCAPQRWSASAKARSMRQGEYGPMDPDAEAFDVPVALIVYNRPEFTRQVMAALRLVCPRHVLVVADAPSRAGDDIRCQQVSAAVSEIDWSCEIEVNVADNHLGCRKRPQTGLNWIFERVQQA